MKRLLVFGLLLVSACGGSSTAPSTPAVAQMAGVWTGTATTTAVTGGECLGPVFLTSVGGRSQLSAAITQSGSSVSATVTSVVGGNNSVFSGSVGQSAVQMTFSTCSACNLVGAHCPTGTATRDVKIQTSSINGTVTGNTLTGTESDTYNVFVAGTTTSVGAMVISNSFTMTRQ